MSKADVDIPLTASGSVYPASGVSGYDGPWLEERQSLHFHYMRVPRSIGGSHVLTLSGFAISAPLSHTHLIGWVEAHYSLQKTTNNYSASTSYTQPQKFELDGSPSGPDGTVYQDPLGLQASAGQFGAQGIVRTNQDYIRRQLWQTSDVGSEVSYFKIGATAAVYTDVSGEAKKNYNWNFFESWTNYDACLERKGMWHAYSPRRVVEGQWLGNKHVQTVTMPIHTLIGPYAIAKETNTQQVKYVMDGLAYGLNHGHLVSVQPTQSEKVNNGGFHVEDRVLLLEYDVSKHSYN